MYTTKKLYKTETKPIKHSFQDHIRLPQTQKSKILLKNYKKNSKKIYITYIKIALCIYVEPRHTNERKVVFESVVFPLPGSPDKPIF